MTVTQDLLIARSSQQAKARLLHGRDMICFSHDWGGDPLSKTHLMRLLARDNRILWVNSIGYRLPTATRADASRVFRKLQAVVEPLRQPIPSLFVLNALAIPAYGSALIRALNHRLLTWQVRAALRRLGFRRPINWVFNPAAGVVAGSLGEDMLIYYCVDEYTQFTGVDSQALAMLEQQLVRRANLVIVSAERLFAPRAQLNPHTVLVRHGVDYHHFRKALELETEVPADIAQLPRPIIGYFGLIAPDWVDVALLNHVARRFPHGSLVLLGKQAMNLGPLPDLPNVHLLGRKPYESLPAYCKGFDVALVPFPISEVTLNANPLKAREYLAAGVPVVSTPVPEVAVLGPCRIAADPESFVREIQAALADCSSRRLRSETMQRETWEARLDEVEQHLSHVHRRSLPR